MTKKDPPSPLDVISELLVTALGRIRAEGANIDASVAQAGVDMKALIRTIEEKAKDPAVRAQATAEVQKLIDLVTTFGRALGTAIAEKDAAMGKAVRDANSQQVAEGMRKLLEFLKNPTPEKAAETKADMAELKTQLENDLAPAPAPTGDTDDKKVN
jgi:hypothetical protein